MKFKSRIRKALIVAGALSFLAVGTGCSFNEIEPDAVGLLYSKGSAEGRAFVDVVKSGTVKYTVNDEVVQLPTSDRSYRIQANSPDADVDGYLSVPAGGAAVTNVDPSKEPTTVNSLLIDFEVSTAFKLNTRTEDITGFKGGTARKFYEQLCRSRDCDLEGGKTPDGWKLMLKDKFYPSLASAFKDEARKYNPDDLVNNTNGALTKLQTDVGRTFLGYLKSQTGASYFCGPALDHTVPALPVPKDATEEERKKIEEANCPPLPLIIISADYNNDDVRKAREEKKVAQDRSSAQGTLSKALKDPNYLEYLRIEAYTKCVQNPAAKLCTLPGTNVAIAP
ncbi:MAG TPA: hypothetical protein VF572_04090 [Candidatus Saccharimonadales bacterium]|jgi:hypothetical protein